MAILDVENLTFSYDRQVDVLSDVSLSVEPGTIVGLVGPNGSGKSTLIKTVFDLLRPRSGRIRIGGLPHDDRRAIAQTLHVASNDHLPDFLTAREYLAMMARLYRVRPDHDRAAALFEDLAMGGRDGDLIDDFSHGMRKKTQLVSALTMRRPLTVIDETMNGIDLEAVDVVSEGLRTMRAEGGAIVLCTHDLPLLERIADRVVLLRRGTVAVDAPVPEVVGLEGSVPAMVRAVLASDLDEPCS